MKAKITATAKYLPKKTLTYLDLEKMVDTSEEWILSRTGIEKRHLVSKGEATSDMCKEVALELIKKSLEKIEFKSFIAISSTRVYGSSQYGELSEANKPEPSDFRGRIVFKYENLVKSSFGSKSLILRLSGLYDDKTNWINSFVTNFDGQKRNLPNVSTNRLHRDTCAEIIAFTLNNDLYLNNDVINCSEGSISYKDLFEEIYANKNFSDYFNCDNKNIREVSNLKLKELGFKFK